MAVSAHWNRVFVGPRHPLGFSHFGRVELPSILTPTARNGRSGGLDDATRVVLVPTPVQLAAMTVPRRPVPAARPSLVLRAASVSDVQNGKNGIGPSSRETNLRKQLNSTTRALPSILRACAQPFGVWR